MPSIIPSVFPIHGVNFKNTGDTTIIAATSGAKHFHMLGALYVFTERVGITGDEAQFKIVGDLGGAVDLTQSQLAGLGQLEAGAMTLGNGSGDRLLANLGTLVKLTVTSAATGTTLTGSIFLIGLVV